MATTAVKINPVRLRVVLNRLPFFTRIVFSVIVLAWLISLILIWVPSWGALIPSEVGIFTAYRLNTFPFVHTGFIHTIISLIALTPLLERFEAEHGTLVTIALIMGPFSTLPGIIYIVIDHLIFRQNGPIQGASIWIFLFLATESIKAYRANPTFTISTYPVPLWTLPLAILLTLAFLLPRFLSPYLPLGFLGNLAGAAVGYAFELGYLKLLLPPEKILRFIEGKLNLLGRLPHYVSVDQKTYGRYGVLPGGGSGGGAGSAAALEDGTSMRRLVVASGAGQLHNPHPASPVIATAGASGGGGGGGGGFAPR